ncbi:MAG: polysaccharide pyruvyl transferase family protein [Mesorhizobium sp.]|nr:MAG: polysaccharide pyruvyl transferase family protein [Mesorhizobium sp.]
MLTIAVENSTWNNMGDAFYQTSLQRILQAQLPQHRVVSFDGPIKRGFRPGRFGRHSFDVRTWTHADHYVFSGPIFHRFVETYGDLIKAIVDKGSTYSFISVHSNTYDWELPNLRSFLTNYPPKAIHTRDRYTYDKIGDLAKESLDGICFAFFVRYLDGIPDLAPRDPYLCSSFHSIREPVLTCDPAPDEKSFVGSAVSFELKKANIPWRWDRHLDFKRAYPLKLGHWSIIRPVHGLYGFSHLVFSRPNSYVTYNPLNFLSIYKHCDGVLTDRVHAGVVALSFGRPVRLLAVDKRFELFSNAPITRTDGIFEIDNRELAKQYERHTDWIRNNLLSAILT